MIRKLLMTPGPSPVPSFVREGMAREIIHHRTDEFRSILEDVYKGLKPIFCTNNPVLVFSSSGTGAMEAAVSNLFSSNDKVVVICGGKFGQRWEEIAKSFSLDVIPLNVEWGSYPLAEDIKKILSDNKDVKGVFATLCETSTATVYDIEGISKVVKEFGCLFIVDAVSGLGQDKILTDEWGIDVVVSGSQKGLMLPPGLSFMSVSKEAQSAMKSSNLPKYYLDLKKALKSYANNDTPYTPAVSMIVALREAIGMINSEGIEQRWKKFEKMAYASRQAAEALGLEVFSKRPSASVTAICSPEGISSSEIVKNLRKNYGLSIAGGQDSLKNKIFRIAHMGWINEQDLLACFSLLESVLKELGYKFKMGSSITRLEEVFYE